MKAIIKFITRSNLFVAICASSLVWQTMILVSPDSEFYFDVIVVFLSTLFIYNFHRLVKIRQISRDSNVKELESETKLYLRMSILSLLFLLPCFYYFDSWHWLIFCIGGVIAITYSIPILGFKSKKYSLRTAPYVKLFALVIVWMLMTVIFPFKDANFESPEFVLIMLERLCFLFAITLPFDIRDMEMDRDQQVLTIPLKYGWRRSIMLSNGFLLVFLILVLLGYFKTIHNIFQTSALLISVLITFIAIQKSRPDSSLIHYTFYLEGTSLAQSLLIWFSYLVFAFI